MAGGWIGAMFMRGPFAYLKELTEADEEILKDIIDRMHEKARYGFSMDSEGEELAAFWLDKCR